MNILCFGPFSAAWDLHGYVEMGILQALKEKKANIINVFCDIKSEYCYLFLYGEAECTFCKQRALAFATEKNLPFIWLSRFARPEDHALAVQFIDSLAPKAYPHTEYEGKKIGEWVISTFISYVREKSFDWHKPEQVKIFRGMLVYALEVALALERLLDQGRYDRVLMFNGRFLPFSILLALAESRGIPCYLHERGAQPDTYKVLRHNPAQKLHPMTIDIPAEILRQPLSPEQLEKTQALMLARESGKTATNWDRYAPATVHEDLRSQLGIGKDKRVWAFFATSDDEMAAYADYMYQDFPTQLDGLIPIIQIVSGYPDVHLVIRIHPHTGSKGEKRVPWSDRLTAFLRKRNYPNVTVIGADDEVNTYELMRLAEVGLVSESTCAIEMVHRGKPAMAFTKGIDPREGIFVATDKESMKNILERLHKGEISRAEIKECFRKSLRYRYFRLFRQDIPFEILKQTSPHTVIPLFKRVEEIKNSRFPNLDKLSGQILRNEEISFDYGKNVEQEASLSAEDAWLDAYVEEHFCKAL